MTISERAALFENMKDINDKGMSISITSDNEEMGELVPLEDVMIETDKLEEEYLHEVKSLNNAFDSMSCLIDKESEIGELLTNPSNITISQVEDARKVINLSIANIGGGDEYADINKRDTIATESFNDPFERMQIAREDIMETIKKVSEFFINIFRKIISWFKKMVAKFVATFNANHSRCVKLRKDLVTRSAASAPSVDPDEIKTMFVSNPYIGAAWEKESSVTNIVEYVHSDKIVQAVSDIIKVAGSIMILSKDIAVDKGESSQEDVNKAAQAIIKNVTDVENAIKKFKNDAKTEEEIFKKIGAVHIETEDKRDTDVIVPYRMDGKKLKALRIAYDNANVEKIIADAKTNNKKGAAAAVLDGLANEFVFEYKYAIELDEDEDTIKKNMPGKLLAYQSLKTIVNKMEKYAKKSPEHCKKILKNLTDGENLSKNMQQAYKAIAVNDGVSYGTAAMKRACNLAKVAAVDLGVDIILGAIKTQTIILKQVEEHIKFYDKKKGK